MADEPESITVRHLAGLREDVQNLTSVVSAGFDQLFAHAEQTNTRHEAVEAALEWFRAQVRSGWRPRADGQPARSAHQSRR